MKAEEPNPLIAEHLAPWIELLDKGLVDEPIHRRPMHVAMQLVLEDIIKVSGPGTKDDYFEQEWFGALVATVTRWYLRRYGEDLLRIPESTVAGAVVIFGTLFKVTVPTNPTRPGKTPGTKDIYFTSRLLDDEDPREWIVNAPNLAELNPLELETFEASLRSVCTRIRSIVNGLAGSALDTEAQGLAYSITTHLDNAVSSFTSGDTPGKQLAVWELHLAVEKALKAFIRSNGNLPPHIHDLRKLLDLSRTLGLMNVPEPLLGRLPATKDVVDYRYGDLPAPYVESFLEWYVTSLEIVDLCVNALPRGFFGEHATITVQALPWHPSRRGGGGV